MRPYDPENPVNEKKEENGWRRKTFDQESDGLFAIGENFRCADYDPAKVAQILLDRKKMKFLSTWNWQRVWDESSYRREALDYISWVLFGWCSRQNLKNPYSFLYRLSIALFLFFLSYFLWQINFQLDLGWFCTHELLTQGADVCSTGASSNSSAGLLTPEEGTQCCRILTEQMYVEWGQRLQSLTRLLTFLLGFYMSRTVASWSDTVRKIPTMEPSLLIFAGLVSHDNSKFSLPVSKEGKKSCTDFSGATLEAKKTIARYGILAWVLCFNTISLSFNRKFKTVEQLKKKGLLKEREESGLKAFSKAQSAKRVVSESWAVPINWALTLIMKIGPNGPSDGGKNERNQIIIPKDNLMATLMASLMKFKDGLNDQKAKSDNPLPRFYRRVLSSIVFAWTILAGMNSQGTVHGKEWNMHIGLGLLFNFPYDMFFMVVALHGWLWMTNILSDPFSGDPIFDIDLEEELELMIWSCSETIEEQSKKIIGTEKEKEKIQNELWKLVN